VHVEKGKEKTVTCVCVVQKHVSRCAKLEIWSQSFLPYCLKTLHNQSQISYKLLYIVSDSCSLL